MFSRALDNARVNPQNTSLAASTTFVGSNMYTLYTGPARTAASGYAYPEASDDLIILENASSATPTQTTWMFAIALGHALDEIGLTETALPVLEKVVQEEPEQPEALLALAAAKYKSRNYAEASGLITRVLSVNPQNPDAAVLQTQTQEALRQMAPPVQEEARQTAKTQPPSVHNTPRPHRNKVPPLKNLKK